MSELTVKTVTEDDFFKRGRAFARLADEGKRLPEQFVVSFEAPEDSRNSDECCRPNMAYDCKSNEKETQEEKEISNKNTPSSLDTTLNSRYDEEEMWRRANIYSTLPKEE